MILFLIYNKTQHSHILLYYIVGTLYWSHQANKTNTNVLPYTQIHSCMHVLYGSALTHDHSAMLIVNLIV